MQNLKVPTLVEAPLENTKGKSIYVDELQQHVSPEGSKSFYSYAIVMERTSVPILVFNLRPGNFCF